MISIIEGMRSRLSERAYSDSLLFNKAGSCAHLRKKSVQSEGRLHQAAARPGSDKRRLLLDRHSARGKTSGVIDDRNERCSATF